MLHHRLTWTLTLLLAAAVVLPSSAGAAKRTKVVATPAPKVVATPAPKVVATPAPKVVATPAPKVVATPAPTATEVAASSEMTESCVDTPTFQAFKAFGDNAQYAFAPGGSFESGAVGWSLSGAAVVTGNDTSGVSGGSKSLRIADGGRVVSPWFCVTPANPHFRYTTRGGEIEMEIDYKVIGESDIDDDLVGETNGGSTWAPSQMHELATEIPASKLAKGVLARIIFEAEDDVYVDNVLVDPYRRG